MQNARHIFFESARSLTRGTRRARRRQRGTAMVEGVIVAPVLVLIFFGATYFRALYVARAQARLEARTCAWEHAMSGCVGSAPSCTPESQPVASTAEPTDAPDIASIARSHSSTGDLDPFSDIPIIGSAFQELFGTSTSSAVEREVPFPLDPQRIGIARGESVVLCNSHNQTVFAIAEEFLCEGLSSFGLCEG